MLEVPRDTRPSGHRRCAGRPVPVRLRVREPCPAGQRGRADRQRVRCASPKPATVRLWLNGTDTPKAARTWLTAEFAKANPGSTLKIEQQQWEGLVERLTTSLSSASETPDVVEVGNTQAPTFTAAGAFTDVTDSLDDLGGDDLLPGFVEAGTVEGRTYAVPYYAGSKFVFYRKDLFQKAGVAVPTTLEELVQAADTLKKADPRPAFSGFWFPGQDWRNGLSLVWANGGAVADAEGSSWQPKLSSPESLAGLQQAQALFQTSGAGKDANETDPQVPFCAGQAAMLSAPGWLRGVLMDKATGCPELMAKVGAFALPGKDGGAAPVLLGGSDLAIAAKSPNQELARNLVDLMLGEQYQTLLGKAGLTPGLLSLSGLLGEDEFAQAAVGASENARLTPAAAGWATVEGSRTMEDLFVGLAKGGDPAELAGKADAAIGTALSR